MVILAEAIAQVPEQGLPTARALSKESEKYQAFQSILVREPVAFFLKLHEAFAAFLKTDRPLILVTDWSDPSEVVGLRLEDGDRVLEDPMLCFLGFYTDWSDLEGSGIAEIFGHELSHLWLHWMGYDPGRSQSNRFHTCTAITDPYLAFAEGFAEHFEIVAAERMQDKTRDEYYDHGFTVDAWLCTRDSRLREQAVKNNRFLYQTALPEEMEEDYSRLHAMHNTSSAFLPERLKNGAQAVASEGVIASFFYQLYRSCQGGQEHELYTGILRIMSTIDLTERTVFTDFVAAYMNVFPQKRELVLDLFGQVTNYVTVSPEAREVFGALYREGRIGNVERFIEAWNRAKELKKKCVEGIRSGQLALDGELFPEIWMTGDSEIIPVPWEPERRVRLRFDVNTATAVDFYSIKGLTFEDCRKLERVRDSIGGFRSAEEFEAQLEKLQRNGVLGTI